MSRSPQAVPLVSSLAILLSGAACAAKAPVVPPPTVDLNPARSALEEARKAAAKGRAAEVLAEAEKQLVAAEGLAGAPDVASRQQAAVLAGEAEAAARCAVDLSQTITTSRAAAAADSDKLAARLKRAEEDQRRLEDRVALLQRDLEVTETELIRSKSRIKGNETKAEASAAIAEARILIRRLGTDRGRASVLARCRESLAKAEEQLLANNFGAAIFFAQKAQDTATRSAER